MTTICHETSQEVFLRKCIMSVFTTIFGQGHNWAQPKPANVRINDCVTVAPRTGNENALPS